MNTFSSDSNRGQFGWVLITSFLFLLLTGSTYLLHSQDGDSNTEHQENGDSSTQNNPALQEILFKYENKSAERVSIVGDFNQWDPNEDPMTKEKNGVWKLTLKLRPGKVYQYAFLVDGKMITDPNAPNTKDGKYSVISVPGGEESTDFSDVSDVEKESLSVLFRNMKERLRALELQMSDMNETLEKYNSQLMTKDATIRSLRNELENVKKEKVRKEVKLVDTKAQLKQLTKERDRLLDVKESLNLQIDKLKTKLKTVNKNYNDLQKRYNNLLSDYENNKTLSELQTKVKRLKEENRKLKQYLKKEKGLPDSLDQDGEEDQPSSETAEATGKPSGSDANEKTEEPTSETTKKTDDPADTGESQTADLPHHTGEVLMIDPGKGIVVINLHGKHGLKPGVTIFAVDKEGKVIGKLDVFRVFNEKRDKFSFCRPVEAGILGKIAKGDTVQTYKPGASKQSNTNTDEKEK